MQKMTLRVVDEGLLALFAKQNRVHFDMMQNQDDRFSLFRKMALYYLQQKKAEAKKNVSKRVENHRILEKDHLSIDCVMSSVL